MKGQVLKPPREPKIRYKKQEKKIDENKKRPGKKIDTTTSMKRERGVEMRKINL